jgi:hypothetical protein
MSRDSTIPLADAVRPTLPPGEELRVAAGISTDPGTVEDVDRRSELIELVNPLNWVGLGVHPGEFLQRVAFGRAVVGPEGSMGRLLHAAVHTVRDVALVVTDRRLVAIVVESEISARTVVYQPGKVLIESPRAAVTGAQMAPKGLLRRARFTVSFADGSRCALLAQLPSLASRLVAELSPT